MLVLNKQNRLMLACVIITTVSACGAGPNSDNQNTNSTPAMGEANEQVAVDTASQSSEMGSETTTSVTPTPVTPVAPVAQAPEPEPATNSTETLQTTDGAGSSTAIDPIDSTNTPDPDPIDSAEPTAPTAPTDTNDNPDNTDGESGTSNPPPSVSCTASPSEVQKSTLYLINQVRSQERMCGSEFFASAPPVVWNAILQAAALGHSNDMAEFNFFSHTGSDGSSVALRVTNNGYNWRTVGENIAAGQTSTAQVVEGWTNSPGHCSNLMNPSFEEIAVTCTEDNGSQYRQYWTNVLGATFSN